MEISQNKKKFWNPSGPQNYDLGKLNLCKTNMFDFLFLRHHVDEKQRAFLIHFPIFSMCSCVLFVINLCFISWVHVLWWNESMDSRAAGRHQSHEDPRVVAAGKLSHSAWILFRITLIRLTNPVSIFMWFFSSSGKRQLPSVSAEHASNSDVVFTFEVVF